MLRESGNKKYEKKIQKRYPLLSSKFIFLYPAYNLRNNELSAVIGINQLKRLDANNLKRTKNFIIYLKNINNKIYRTDYEVKGSCNYAFPLVLKNNKIKHRDILEENLNKNKIEFRRGNAGGGNQLRQPYLKSFSKKIDFNQFKEVEHIHSYGYSIGNYPDLNRSKILKICKILNTIKYD